MGVFRQAVLVLTTAVLISFLPSFFRTSFPVPEIYGVVSPGFEEVAEVFRKNFELGWDKSEGGSAFAVYYKGEKVVDLWAGYADQEAKLLWKEDTLSLMFSTTKGLSALVIAMLADRGLIDFKKPVKEYWPEFGQKGKEKITVEMLMEHEAGLPVVYDGITFDLLRDTEALDRALALSEPLWEPGTAHGYHALSIGLFASALVRRVDPKNRTLGQFFAEEVADVFGIDAFIGTPSDQYHRLSRPIHVQPSLLDNIHAFSTNRFYRYIFLTSLFQSPSFALLMDIMKNCGEVCEEMNLFGSAGLGGQIGYADPNKKIGYGFVSRYLSPQGLAFIDPRSKYLQESVLRAVKKIENQ
ncbi:putative beta-lactamase domain-containing protein 2 [Apostichopus japonicus]|uniref:Putative beta-lactamase domain-containing protein 2 n=1 Tax=Stichopus japonicus TaxID=307972 RepID=A0A2G8L878_STIJA|nr:putative beta-lactamase domain-containing protein 2 [Apostichopus japonicus]